MLSRAGAGATSSLADELIAPAGALVAEMGVLAAEAGEGAVELCSRLEGELTALTLELVSAAEVVSAAEALSAAEVALAEAALAEKALAAEKESGIRSSRTTGTWMVSSSLSSSTGTG